MKGLFGLGKKKDDQKNEAQNNPSQPIPVTSGKYLVQYDKKKCIGAGTCEAVAPNFWKMRDDGKAELLGSTQPQEGMFERVISDAEFAANKMAADGCPSNCIHIINKETGEKII